MADIFISYSSDDRPQAQALADFLVEKGYDVWWDQDLSAGEIFRKRIRSAIAECKVAIVIWTESSIGKDWVLDEADDARVANKLIPLRADDLKPEQIPDGFRQLHAIPLSDRSRLLDAIKPRIDQPQQVPGFWDIARMRANRWMRSLRSWLSWKTAAIAVVVCGLGGYVALDFLDWQRIKDSLEPSDFRRHQQKFPLSLFASQARAKLSGVDEWDAVKGSRNAVELTNFAEKFPGSLYTPFVRLRLGRLQAITSGKYKRVLPDASLRALGENDLKDLKCDTLWTARNEIFYALGYCFVSDAATRAFNTPADCPYRNCKMVNQFDAWVQDEILTDTERDNVTAMQSKEKQIGCRFTVIPSACSKP